MKNILTSVLLSGLLATALIAGDGKDSAACSAEASLKKAEAKSSAMACCPSDAKATNMADKAKEMKKDGKTCCPSDAVAAADKADKKDKGTDCASCAAKS